jgi:ubiquinone/menaquinone biosynthesis C-methylase UbiE
VPQDAVTAAFEPHRFSSAAAHYRRGRAAYAPALIRQVADAAGLGSESRVLDLGCGPGPLAIGFGYFAGEVLGLDPEPNMIAAAQDAAAGLTPNVRFVLGSSWDLSPALGRFQLVTMGRSFHWMDRSETLRRLDRLIEPTGAVALFADSHPDVPENAWRAAWRDILDRYREPGMPPRGGGGRLDRHRDVLEESVFSALTVIRVLDRRTISSESLIDRALSMSSTSAGRIGAAAEGMVTALREVLREVAPGGQLTELVESHAVLARRGPG